MVGEIGWSRKKLVEEEYNGKRNIRMVARVWLRI